jgi:type IV secretion system protein VirB6
MTVACPSLNDLSDIGALMIGVDCQSAAYVAAAYEGLFGASGSLAQVLAGALTIYVAFYGYRLITGAGSATASDLVRRLALIGAILALSSNWPAYQTLFVGTVTGGAEDLAAMMSTATSGRPASSASIAGEIDVAVKEMTRLATEWSRKTPPAGADALNDPVRIQPPLAPAGVSAVNMLWLGAILLGVSSAGVIVITKITLAFMLALGPLFLILALFPAARGLFEGWLRTIVAGAFVLVFTILATGGALSIIAPIINAVSQDQANGVNDPGAVFTLLIACIVFTMLVRQVLTVTARFTGAWRLPFARDHQVAVESEQAAKAANAGQPFSNDRIAGMVSSVSRDIAPTSSTRTIVTGQMTTANSFESMSESAATRRAARAYRGFGASRVRAAGGYR